MSWKVSPLEELHVAFYRPAVFGEPSYELTFYVLVVRMIGWDEWPRNIGVFPMQMSYNGEYACLPSKGYGFDSRHLLIKNILYIMYYSLFFARIV